jgi:hypothetical protein
MKTETIYKLLLVTLFFYLIFSISVGRIMHTNIDSLEAARDSLIIELDKSKQETQILEDELQFREDEITYWGMKYDSVKTYLQRNK